MEPNTSHVITSFSPPAPSIEVSDNPPIATPTEIDLEERGIHNETMEIDSSDDEAALTRARQHFRRAAGSVKDNKSPITKRTKRSKSRTTRVQGGTISRPSNNHV